MPGVMIELDTASVEAIDKALSGLAVVHHRQVVQKAFREGAKIVAERYSALLPVGKDPEDAAKSGRVPVRQMPSFRVRIYERAIVAMAGFKSERKKGTGGRKLPTNIDALIEGGHVMGGSEKTRLRQIDRGYSRKRANAATVRVIPGTHALEQAISQTKSEVNAAIVGAVQAAVQGAS